MAGVVQRFLGLRQKPRPRLFDEMVQVLEPQPQWDLTPGYASNFAKLRETKEEQTEVLEDKGNSTAWVLDRVEFFDPVQKQLSSDAEWQVKRGAYPP